MWCNYSFKSSGCGQSSAGIGFWVLAVIIIRKKSALGVKNTEQLKVEFVMGLHLLRRYDSAKGNWIVIAFAKE